MPRTLAATIALLPALAASLAHATDTVPIVGSLAGDQAVLSPKMSGDGTTVFFNFRNSIGEPLYPTTWVIGKGASTLTPPVGLDRPEILSIDASSALRVGVAYVAGAEPNIASLRGTAWSASGAVLPIAMPGLRPFVTRDGATILANGAATDDITRIDVATDARTTIAKPAGAVSGKLVAADESGSYLVGDYSAGGAATPYRFSPKLGWQPLSLPSGAVFASVDAISADGQKAAGITYIDNGTTSSYAVTFWDGNSYEWLTLWPTVFSVPSVVAHDARMRAVVVVNNWSDLGFTAFVLTRNAVEYDSASYLASHGMTGIMPSWTMRIHSLSDDATTALVETQNGSTPELFLVRGLAPPECGSGDCMSAHAAPGCFDGRCCARVCAIDPFCCDNSWDALCANEAATSCFPRADLNEDGHIDGADLAILLANWGAIGPTDIDLDGQTGASDLAVLLASWG